MILTVPVAIASQPNNKDPKLNVDSGVLPEEYYAMKQQIDSLRVQVNLNVDLFMYRITKINNENK